MNRDEILSSLSYAVQYRRKEGVGGWFGFDPWHTMAAFDVCGAAETYFGTQNNPHYECRLVDISEDAANKRASE